MSMQLLVAIGGASAAILSVIAFVTYVVRLVRRVSSQLENFREDWYGEQARPGRPAIPGVPDRLASIEHELTTNGGSSLKDAVNRMEKQNVELRDMFLDHIKSNGA